jgi:hypothetical protein
MTAQHNLYALWLQPFVQHDDNDEKLDHVFVATKQDCLRWLVRSWNYVGLDPDRRHQAALLLGSNSETIPIAGMTPQRQGIYAPAQATTPRDLPMYALQITLTPFSGQTDELVSFTEFTKDELDEVEALDKRGCPCHEDLAAAGRAPIV